MKTLLQNNPDKFGISKYQMNWPGNGDPYYTAEGGTRRTYYGVNAVPMIFFNGKNINSVNQATFNTALNEPAFMDIVGTYSVSGTTVTANVDISSYMETGNVRVYAIVNEKTTTGNTGPNGEQSFIHVMMKMMPNAEGTTTSFDAGETKSFAFTQNMAGTHVEEYDDLEVHVFVQNHSSKYIYNSNFLVYGSTHFYPPTNLTLQNNNNGTVTASWDAPETQSNTGYNIYLNGQLVQSNYTSESITVTLPNPVGYQAFKINAIYTANNTSAYCSDYILINNNEQPTSLTAELDDMNVILSWTAPTGTVDSYILYCNGNKIQGAVTGNTFTHKSAPMGFNIYGVASTINGSISEIDETTIEVPCALLPPENLETVVNGTSLEVSWDPTDYDNVTYNVYLDETLFANISVTTILIDNLTEGNHVLGISSVFGTCESAKVVTTFLITIEKSEGAAVDTPTLASKTENTIVINPVTLPENGQTVEYGINTEEEVPDEWQEDVTFSDLEEGTTYYIYARSAENENYFAGEASDPLEVETDFVGIITVGADLFKIYPNPTKGQLKIENGELEIESVEVYDITGSLVGAYPCGRPNSAKARTQEGAKAMVIDISHLPAGIYFVQINSYTVKIVKI
jgi:hypothetical protein